MSFCIKGATFADLRGPDKLIWRDLIDKVDLLKLEKKITSLNLALVCLDFDCALLFHVRL